MRVPALSALLLAACMALPALAEEKPDFFVGGGLYHRSGPYYTKHANEFEPTGDYDGEHFLVRGDEIGLKLWHAGPWTMAAIVQNDLLDFRASDATDARQALLDDRKRFIGAGLELQWQATRHDTLRAAVLGDAAQHSHGQRATLYYEHSFEIPDSYTQIIPYLGASWFERREARYYFGVGEAESARSGLAVFAPRHASRFDVGLSVVQPLSERVALYADVDRHQLAGGAGDSPMLRQTHYAELNLGVVFQIKQWLP